MRGSWRIFVDVATDVTSMDEATGHPSKRIKDAQSPVDKQSILKILR